MPSCLSFLTLLLTACSAPSHSVSIPAWQESVDRYIQEEGNGDPNVLRDMTWARDQKGFAIIGAPVPEKSTDANGVLLAHRVIAGQPRFVYLVGLVDKRETEDIRLAILTPENGQLHWQLSPKNTESLQRYLDYRRQHWRNIYPEAPEAPPGHLAFPRPDDEFQLTVDDGHVTVSHPPSGATWVLDLPPSPGVARAP